MWMFTAGKRPRFMLKWGVSFILEEVFNSRQSEPEGKQITVKSPAIPLLNHQLDLYFTFFTHPWCLVSYLYRP